MAQGGSSGGESVENGYDNLPFADLEKAKEMEEGKLKEFETTFNQTKNNLSAKENEAKDTKLKYDESVKKWKKLDEAAKGMNKAITDAVNAWTIAEDQFIAAEKLYNEFVGVTEELADAEKDVEDIKNAPQREPVAVKELDDWTKNCAAVDKSKTLKEYNRQVTKTNGDFDKAEKSVKRQEKLVKDCTAADCRHLTTVLDTYRSEFKTADTALKNAEKDRKHFVECPTKLPELKAEVDKLNEIKEKNAKDPTAALTEAQAKVAELEPKSKDTKYDNAEKLKNDAEAVLNAKETAKTNAEANPESTPEEVQKANDLVDAEKDTWTNLAVKNKQLDGEIKKLKLDFGTHKHIYDTKFDEVQKLRKLYAEKQKGEDPGTGSATTIAVVVILIVALVVAAAVGFVFIRKRGKKGDDKQPGSKAVSSSIATPSQSQTPVPLAIEPPPDPAASAAVTPATPTAAANPTASNGNVEVVEINQQKFFSIAAGFLGFHPRARRIPADKIPFDKYKKEAQELMKLLCPKAKHVEVFEATIVFPTRITGVWMRLYLAGFTSPCLDATQFTFEIISILTEPIDKEGFVVKGTNPDRSGQKPHFSIEDCVYLVAEELYRRSADEMRAERKIVNEGIAKNGITKIRASGGTDVLHSIPATTFVDDEEFVPAYVEAEMQHLARADMAVAHIKAVMEEMMRYSGMHWAPRAVYIQGGRAKFVIDEFASRMLSKASSLIPRRQRRAFDSFSDRSLCSDELPEPDRENAGKERKVGKKHRDEESEQSTSSKKTGANDAKKKKNKKNKKRESKISEKGKNNEEEQSSSGSDKKSEGTRNLDDDATSTNHNVEQPRHPLSDAELQQFSHLENGDERPKFTVDQACTKSNDIIADYIRHRTDKDFYVDHKEDFLLNLANHSKKIFERRDMCLDIKGRVAFFGDVHGSLDSVLALMVKFGGIGSSCWKRYKFVFLGDYVDKGTRSLDVIVVLLLLQIQYPKNIFLVRGNHECSAINKVYGFKNELEKRYKKQNALKPEYSETLRKHFNFMFAFMSISAVINNKIFASHGGIPKRKEGFRDLDDVKRAINAIQRPVWNQNSDEIAKHVSWDDPALIQANAEDGRAQYTREELDEFMRVTGIKLIVRAHQVMYNGYDFFRGGRLISLFSCTNYDPTMHRNLAAILIVEEDFTCFFHVLDSYDEEYMKRFKAMSDKEKRNEMLLMRWAHNLRNFSTLFKGIPGNKAVGAAAC